GTEAQRDEHRTSNTRLPCITNDGGTIIVTGLKHEDILPISHKGIAGRSNVKQGAEGQRHKGMNIERPTLNTRLPCIINDGGYDHCHRAETRGKSTKATQRHCGTDDRFTKPSKLGWPICEEMPSYTTMF
ncbi:MAG: hypothetical protein U9N82_09665, partial [Thermodesulfobacteriota bacterium]|nr:hypothetical protein [Thermodesulfobacteriota bacterium]